MTDKGQSNEAQRVSVTSLVPVDPMAGKLANMDVKVEAKKRLTDARAHLFSAEREMIAEANSFARQTDERVRAIEARAEHLLIEARAIEADAAGRSQAMLNQARMERELAERITSIAEDNALAILDKIRDASDSMMDWAQGMADDLGSMMKRDAANEVARKMEDLEAVREAMDDETRAGELLDLAAQLRRNAA